MSFFISVYTDKTIPNVKSGHSIRVSIDCVAAFISEGNGYQLIFKPGTLPEYFYQGVFRVSQINPSVEASMGLKS